MIRARFVLPPLLTLLVAAACSKSASNPTATITFGTDAGDASVALDAAGAPDASDGATAAALDDAGACTSPDFTGAPLGVHCNALVDTSGRTVLLHGVNARVAGVFDVTFTDGRLPVEAVPVFTAADAARIRALGFNALRLPISWSGVEPTEDGGISASYLDNIAAVTAMCAAAGVFVIVDLHQDSYSKEIGEDGAPLWAIVPPPTQLLGGPLSGDRFDSAQVQDAYDTFFGQAEDAGVPLRARYTLMASKVAARFASDPAVVGFELYNEPYSDTPDILALYQQMIPAVRAAAPQKLIFFEPDAIRNEIGQAPLGNGSLGAGTAYAPHVYTLAFTDANATGVTYSTYAVSNVNARTEADSWQAPLVITEYGYPPQSTNFDNWAKWMAEAEDSVKASSFFWVWKEESQDSWGFYDFDDAGVATERPAVVQAMTRTRLEAVAGALVSEGYDEAAMTMTVVFDGSDAITAPNVLSVGAGATVPAAQWTATCDGKSVPTGGADPLSIACGGNGVHTLVVSAGGGGDE
jgi:endoglycosylceramidase